jgi:membrane protein implicated in regulation of membrane protease activity
MAKSRDSSALAFTVIGALLTWAGVAGLVFGAKLGTAAFANTLCVLVGVDSLLVALWRTRYARAEGKPPVHEVEHASSTFAGR